MAAKNKKSKLERIKEESDNLRGSIAEELGSELPNFSKKAYQLLKFHGTYQQDDRDKRDGKDKEHIFMVRCRIPGGGLTADQYLAHDDLATRYADNTLRITTRQTFQFHGVVKDNLKHTLKGINDALVTTLGACGDVVRNVMCNPAPSSDGLQQQVQRYANELSELLLPETNAYHETWLDGEKISNNRQEVKNNGEPLYGSNYLPRKFKIGIATPKDNSIDVYTQDIGLIAIPENGLIKGFNITVGGGMGMHHKKPETFPRLGDDMGYVPVDQLVPVVKAIIEVQRDFGDRKDRKQARMKYLIHQWGLDTFQKEVEKRLGSSLQAFKPLPEFEMDLYLGWGEQPDGNWYYGLSVENGRIKDTQDMKMKTGIRKAVEEFRTGIRLTANHDIIFTDIKQEEKEAFISRLKAHAIPLPEEKSNAVKYSMACPAMPTCGLAITESERALPSIIRDIEKELDNLGLQNETITVRMTGCPNGCARPYVADIGFVGRSLDQYSIFIGGDPAGTRLNSRFKDLVNKEELVQEIRPLLIRYKEQSRQNESFSDYWNRVGLEYAPNYQSEAAAS